MPINLHWKIMWTTLSLVCFIISLTTLGASLICIYHFSGVWKTSWVFNSNSVDIKLGEPMTWKFYNFFPNRRVMVQHSFGLNYDLATEEDEPSTGLILERYKDQPICSITIESKGHTEKYTSENIMELLRQGSREEFKGHIQEFTYAPVIEFTLQKGFYTVTVIPNVNFIREMLSNDKHAGFRFKFLADTSFYVPSNISSMESSYLFLAGDSRMLYMIEKIKDYFPGKGHAFILPIAWVGAIIMGIFSVFFGIIFIISFKRRLKDVYKSL